MKLIGNERDVVLELIYGLTLFSLSMFSFR
jgi:hypothetical protein